MTQIWSQRWAKKWSERIASALRTVAWSGVLLSGILLSFTLVWFVWHTCFKLMELANTYLFN